jgi:predicted ATPase
MKGPIHIRISNVRVTYDINLKRKFTIINGDSATGKTTLVSMAVLGNQGAGRAATVDIVCSYNVRAIATGTDINLLTLEKDTVYFIDEEELSTYTNTGFKKMLDSENFFVLVTRRIPKELPSCATEVCCAKSSGKLNNALYMCLGEEVE